MKVRGRHAKCRAWGCLVILTALAIKRRNMKQVAIQMAVWSGLYLLIVVLLLVLTGLPPVPAGRGFWVELGVALGIVAFAMLALQFATTARFRRIAPYFGSDALLIFHRQAGILAVVVVFAHPLVLCLARPEYLAYFDPRINAPRAVALSVVLVAVAAIVALSLWRRQVGLSYEGWRLSHAGLSALVIAIGLIHALQVNHFVAGLGKQALWVFAAAVPLALLAYLRVVKPWLSRRRPYRVVEVRPERGEAFTLVLEPDGHAGFTFQAGQFAWLALGEHFLSLQQHPFTFSSSAAVSPRIEFTIKELGDFTRSIKDIQPGGLAYLEGPYGNFALDDQAGGAVFVMGGIGVTPAMSILRTLRDQRDRRPLRLIYGNTTWDDVAFREELAALESELKLRVVHVLEDPPDDWQGETGYIAKELLAREHLEGEVENVYYFVCGPTPMMDAAEHALQELGVPPWRLLSERFDIA